MSISITHPDDPTLTATFRPPNEAAWKDYWRAITVPTPDQMTADWNLCLACLETPDARGFVTLCEDWAGLPEVASPHLREMAGGFVALTRRGFANVVRVSGRAFSDDERIAAAASSDAHEVDLRALLPVIEAIEAGVAESQIEALMAAHRADFEALQAAGITAEKIKGWLQRHKEVLCLRTPREVFVLRKPTRSALVSFTNQTQRGNGYDGARTFVATCALHPEPGILPGIFSTSPAACTALAAELRLMADETVAAIIKKG